MKIVVTKDEFARLVRECEHQVNTYNNCSNCVLNTFCNENKIENLCEINIMNTVDQNRLQEFYYTTINPMTESHNDMIN